MGKLFHKEIQERQVTPNMQLQGLYNKLFEGGGYKPNVNSSNEAVFIPLVSQSFMREPLARPRPQREVLRIASLGCGLCAAVDHYSAALGHSAEIFGMDLSSSALQSARALGRGTHCRDPPCLKQGSLVAVPWPDAYFDAVVCSDVMEHIPPANVPNAIREIARVTKHIAFLGIALSSSVNLGTELHLSRFPAEWWTRAFEQQGFRRVDIRHYEWERLWARNEHPLDRQQKPLWYAGKVCEESAQEARHPLQQRCTMLFAFAKKTPSAHEIARHLPARARAFVAGVGAQ
jgi:ubiquinone/menaquinone biosynthesis C-methylase UbiE